MYDTILLPTDGSDGSEQARQTALELGERFGAKLHVIHVVDTRHHSEPVLSATELDTDEAEDRATALLQSVVEEAEDRGLEVTTRCCHGVPHQEIVAHADDCGADLVVIGYHGHTHDERMGSVVDRVLRSADQQVLTA